MSDSSQMSAQDHRTVWLQPLSMSKGYVKGDWSNRGGSDVHRRSTARQYSRALVPAHKAHLHLFALQFWDLCCKICSFSISFTNKFRSGQRVIWNGCFYHSVLSPPCVVVREALAGQRRWELDTHGLWAKLCSRGGSCSCTEHTGAALLTGWVWKDSFTPQETAFLRGPLHSTLWFPAY